MMNGNLLNNICNDMLDFGFESARMILGLNQTDPDKWDKETDEKVYLLEADYLDTFKWTVNYELQAKHPNWKFSLKDGEVHVYDNSGKSEILSEEDDWEGFQEFREACDKAEAELDNGNWNEYR